MSLRSQFPFFKQNDAPIYLDNAATTQKPRDVIDAMNQFYCAENATVHRSSFSQANAVTGQYEKTRQQTADFIGAPSSKNIVWTKGTTESINLAALSWGAHNIKKHDIIVVLGSEHHANFVPWQQLAQAKQAQFKVVNIMPNGDVDLDDYTRLMQMKPKLVAMQHCSNALGNIHPVSDLIQLAKSAGATTLIDGAQAVGHLTIDVNRLNCDFYAFSAHKMYGPTGVGVLYISDNIKDQLKPVYFGGEMIANVSITQSTFRPFPHFLETGTPNIAGIIGFSKAIEFVETNQYQQNLNVINKLYLSLIAALTTFPEITILGNTENNIGIVSFTLDGETVSDIAALLNEQNIAIRCGHHCAMPLMQTLNTPGTARVSLACYNNHEDVDTFIAALHKSIQILKI